jgi:hypothetical protein
MELYNDEVPGDTVWALQSRFEDWMTDQVEWYLTAEASSQDYRLMLQYMTEHSISGTVKRFKVQLPRRRMESEDVRLWVEAKLIHDDPDGTAQLLDVGVRDAQSQRR